MGEAENVGSLLCMTDKKTKKAENEKAAVLAKSASRREPYRANG